MAGHDRRHCAVPGLSRTRGAYPATSTISLERPAADEDRPGQPGLPTQGHLSSTRYPIVKGLTTRPQANATQNCKLSLYNSFYSGTGFAWVRPGVGISYRILLCIVAHMARSLLVVSIVLVLVACLAIMTFNSALAPILSLPGLLMVLGGTLLATIISQSWRAVFALLTSLPQKFSESSEDRSVLIDVVLTLADCHRRGDVRGAEAAAKGLPVSFLKTGFYLVIDRHGREHLMRIMQWQLGKTRDALEREVLILRTMGGYAPAFGMLGTLFGLIHMLYGLTDSKLEHIGMSMGFAMLTTVYGLMAATLLFKPLAVKLERHVKHKLAWMYAQYEAVLMIYERQPPQLIKEYLDTFLDDPDTGALDMPTEMQLEDLEA